MAGTLRITGGRLVRRRFLVPKEADAGLVRPTPDRVREAIFSSLGNLVEGARVLDLFAGSGAQGIEALSRGAKEVVFVEGKRDVAANLRQNLEELELVDQTKIVVSDAIRYVAQGDGQFDLIFADPPFALALQSDFWRSLQPLLAKDGLIIFRAFKKAEFELPAGYAINRERVYGASIVYFLEAAT